MIRERKDGEGRIVEWKKRETSKSERLKGEEIMKRWRRWKNGGSKDGGKVYFVLGKRWMAGWNVGNESGRKWSYREVKGACV